MLAVLGLFGAYVGSLVPLWCLCKRSWTVLGASVYDLGSLWGLLLAFLASLAASFRGLGPLQVPLWAVMGSS